MKIIPIFFSIEALFPPNFLRRTFFKQDWLGLLPASWVHVKHDRARLFFLFISIVLDVLSPRLISSFQIPVAFCSDLAFFAPETLAPFFSIELLRDLRLPREIDTNVSPPGSLLKLRLQGYRRAHVPLFSSLSFSLFSLRSLFTYFSLSSPRPFLSLLVTSRSISTRFQNSFISRSATPYRFHDRSMMQRYREPRKINFSPVWPENHAVRSPRSVSYIANLAAHELLRHALTCVSVSRFRK